MENLERTIAISNKKYQDRAKTDSSFDSIREDERFQAFIQ
ncbi:TPR end-of-group domain-containing protein [Nostoc sp. DSM 114161]